MMVDNMLVQDELSLPIRALVLSIVKDTCDVE